MVLQGWCGSFSKRMCIVVLFWVRIISRKTKNKGVRRSFRNCLFRDIQYMYLIYRNIIICMLFISVLGNEHNKNKTCLNHRHVSYLASMGYTCFSHYANYTEEFVRIVDWTQQGISKFMSRLHCRMLPPKLWRPQSTCLLGEWNI